MDSARLDGNDIYNLAAEGYLYELGLLVHTVKSVYFSQLLPQFSNYKSLVASGKTNLFGEHPVERLVQRGNTIDLAGRSHTAEKLLACVNLAACCEIFSGWSIPVGDLRLEQTGQYLQMALANAGTDKQQLGRNMAVRLNNGDAVRVVQLLKLLDLLTTDTHTRKQLSLGASIGRRDRHAFHLTPGIHSAIPGLPVSTHSPLRFGVTPHDPEHLVLIDNDPVLKTPYKRLNEDEKDRVLAMNMDFYEGMAELSQLIANHQAEKRNLVVAFRLEPRAFSDIGRFLDCVSGVVDESSDFVTTIGSGDTLEEFEHRLDVLDKMDKELSARGMRPFRLKCYTGDTTTEQRTNPLFGLNQYASYEILHCKLKRHKLT